MLGLTDGQLVYMIDKYCLVIIYKDVGDLDYTINKLE